MSTPEEAIKQFAVITLTDEAFAHAILQDEDYNLERALTKYFSGQLAEQKSVEVLTAFREEVQRAPAESIDIVEATAVVEEVTEYIPVEGPPAPSKDLPEELTVVTWNIDGLDDKNRRDRMTAVLVVIAKINPEVVFLQEMVDEMLPPLLDLMGPMYNLVASRPEFGPDDDQEAGRQMLPYYCVTLVSRNIRLIDSEIVPFGNSQMCRTAIVVQAAWKGLKLNLINTHLESMAPYTEQRKIQFAECVERMRELMQADGGAGRTLTIFAGDLNIRDNEVCEMPAEVKDAWVVDGKQASKQYTWDMRKNDNNPDCNRFARMRFDRVYYAGPYSELDFSLHGTQRIARLLRFPSDHFAVCCRFYEPIIEQVEEQEGATVEEIIEAIVEEQKQQPAAD